MSQQQALPIQKALILCSNKDVVDTTKAALKSFNFQQIETLENGIDALKHLAKTNYDLVICHNKLKFISGWNFIKEMKTSDKIPNMAAVFMGDDPSPASEDELKQYGLVSYLKTPLNESQMSFLINSTFQLFKTSGTIENKFSKAKAALLSKKSDLAIELYSELHGLTKKNLRSSLGLAESLTQKDQVDKAEAIIAESLLTNGSTPSAMLMQIKIYLKKNKIDEAQKAGDALLKTILDSPFYHSRLLNLYIEVDRVEEAESVCKDAMSKQFRIPEFWHAMSRILYQKARFDESLATLQSALDGFGPSAELMNIKGACLRKANRLAEALQAYENALKLSPMDAKIYYNMAVCCISKKDLNVAKMHLEMCIKITPDFPNAQQKLAEVKKYMEAVA